MTEKELSLLQREYRHFFLDKLNSYGVGSPAQLTKQKKSEFFTSIKNDWAVVKRTKIGQKQFLSVPQEIPGAVREYPQQQLTSIEETTALPRYDRTESEGLLEEFGRQTIKSLPNAEQTDDLKIKYNPNNHFEQPSNYCYPVVKMPASNASLKLPRQGRTNKRGYKEKEFGDQLRIHFSELEVAEDVHMVIPHFNRPYEPDIVLFDKKVNLYIDVEIDEPYDGFYRYPTHCTRPDESYKQEDIRDRFFTESGWVVIRFTEKQVHLQPWECIAHIRNVVNSIYLSEFDRIPRCEIESQWDENQSIQWQKSNYREKYLGIAHFRKCYNNKEISIDTEENEAIENAIRRTKLFDIREACSEIAFDEATHKYVHPKDQTGNAEYVSVTTLIERFFPFDLRRYIERKASEESRTEEDVLLEYLMTRDEAADRGTDLHCQIESYLKGRKTLCDIKEFELFLSFFNEEIKSRNLEFADAEKRIVSRKYNVAGTIDCLFRKRDKDEYVMLDWKRSKKLVIDGRPRLFGYGYALSELNYLDNSSYYKYCLQQNLYKYIVENEYGFKISSMRLVVLHNEYPKYYMIKVPEMAKEAKIILNSLLHKI